MAKKYNNILEWAKDNEIKLTSKDKNAIVKSGGITSLKDATPANYYQMGVEPTNKNYKDMYKEIKQLGDKMAKKNIVSPDRQQPPMAKNMQADLDDSIDQGIREANYDYAPYFNEYNWLKAVSPNLVIKIKE